MLIYYIGKFSSHKLITEIKSLTIFKPQALHR